jgi:hypothetical protein
MLIRDFDTLKKYVKVSVSATWDAFSPYVQDAQRFYIEPYLGTTLIGNLEQIIDSDEQEEIYLLLLTETRRALGPLSYMLATHESSIGFGDAGHTVMRTDKVAPASDEKVRLARESAELRGWQNLEYLLAWLEEKKEDFPEWESSSYLRNPKSKYFRSATDFQELGMVDIEYSRLTFDKLLQLTRRIEVTDIADLVPIEIDNPFYEYLFDNEKKLISYIQAYIASKTAMLHTSQATKQQRTTNEKPEYKPVIRPLYEDVIDTGNYYAGQVDYWRAKIIELLADEFDIDKSGKLNWNATDKKFFVDIG